MMKTTLIRDGYIIDGTGARGFAGHLLIEGDRIAEVIRAGEDLPRADAVIDAKGGVIAPGFIDMHSHVDWLLPTDAQASLLTALLEQGVTTVVAGNCGISPAPMRPGGISAIERLAIIAMEEPLPYDWSSMAEYLERVEGCAPLVNVAELVGHAALRYATAETRRGAMRPHELRACLERARQSLDEGACGLSLGLGYDPGMFSPLEELAAFAAVTAGAGKPMTVHLKALSRVSPCYPMTDRPLEAHNIRALREILDIGRATGVRLQLSHFLFVGRKSWRTADVCLRMVEDARSEGLDVMIDAFPFTCGNTTVNAMLPYWYLADLRRSSRSTSRRVRLRAELELGFRLVGFGLSDLRLMSSGVPGWDDLCGLTVEEIGRRWGTSAFSALLQLGERSRGAAVMLFSTYSGDTGDESALEAVLSRPFCLFETDAVLHAEGHPNPAALGTFPRILGRHVRERGLFGLEAAIHRMTAASAERYGLSDRGRLARGMAADVVVFDPRTISDNTPSGAEPARPPVGVGHVLVNGVLVVDGGMARPGEGAGRVLRT